MRAVFAASAAIVSASAFVLPNVYAPDLAITTATDADLLGTAWNTWKALAHWVSPAESDLRLTKDKSIYEVIADDKDLSKFFRLVKLDEDIVQVLNETTNTEITLFAPNNGALKIPGHGSEDDDESDLSAIVKRQPLVHLYHHAEKHNLFEPGNDDDDDEKKRRREAFRRILKAVLQYHTLPQPLSAIKLSENSTTITGLKATDGSYGGENRRIRIESRLLPPGLVLNAYADVVRRDIKAKNGYVHVINHPLIPPPSIVEVSYLVSKYLSTFTSAIQKLHLNKELDWKYVHGAKGEEGHFKGSPALTVFAPSNDAWAKLPDSLLYFLFTPFGAKALTKLLQFHVVPNYIIHTEWVHRVDPHKGSLDSLQTPFAMNPPNPSVPFDVKFVVPTLLANHTLPVHITKSKAGPVPIPGTKLINFFVNGKEVAYFDGVASNGAVHAVDVVLDPRGRGRPHENLAPGWENWEDWFVKWSEQA